MVSDTWLRILNWQGAMKSFIICWQSLIFALSGHSSGTMACSACLLVRFAFGLM